MKDMEIDNCNIIAIALPLTFLLMPFVFEGALVGYETKPHGKGKKVQKKMN